MSAGRLWEVEKIRTPQSRILFLINRIPAQGGNNSPHSSDQPSCACVLSENQELDVVDEKVRDSACIFKCVTLETRAYEGHRRQHESGLKDKKSGCETGNLFYIR